MVAMSRSQDINSDLTLVFAEHEITKDGNFDLWAFLFEEKTEEDTLSMRVRAERLHVYVTRSYRPGRMKEAFDGYKRPPANVIDPLATVSTYISASRPTDSFGRTDPAHADADFQSELVASALSLAASNSSAGAQRVNPAHIQQLAKEAMKRHKASMSEATDYLGVAFFGKLSDLDGKVLAVEALTMMERRSLNVLQAFYMLYAMGLRSNIRQLIAELWGYSDNQVKVALQFLKEQGILSQRDATGSQGSAQVG